MADLGAAAAHAEIEDVELDPGYVSPSPLDGLVEQFEKDPGAAFRPEVLGRLVVLKAEDRAGFEALRARLKKAGYRVTALDEAISEEMGDGGRGLTQKDILIHLAGAAELFHSADGTAFADLMIDDHRETWPVRTKGFRRWLARQLAMSGCIRAAGPHGTWVGRLRPPPPTLRWEFRTGATKHDEEQGKGCQGGEDRDRQRAGGSEGHAQDDWRISVRSLEQHSRQSDGPGAVGE